MEKALKATKTTSGNFFEDFSIGQKIVHATPRTLTDGDRALYGALYPSRFAMSSSEVFAESCGLAHPLDDLILFHAAFGKTVPEVSLNAVANLGYAEGRFLEPAFVGMTIHAESEVIGLKQNSNGRTGVVWVRSRAYATEPSLLEEEMEFLDAGSIAAARELGRPRLAAEWVRWVMVRKRDPNAPAPETVTPELAAFVPAGNLTIPESLDFSNYDNTLAGSPYRWGDYSVGEKIDHVDGATIEDAEHMMATRLWQNTAKVHFNTQLREDGKRLVYGGHIISLARALSFNGLENAQMIAAINAGAHANPAFAGDTVYAWSEVLDKAETSTPSVGALRLRLVAVKHKPAADFRLKGADGKYLPDVLLDLDYWVLMPR